MNYSESAVRSDNQRNRKNARYVGRDDLRQQTSIVKVEGEGVSVSAIIDSSLPDEAYAMLFTLDLSDVGPGPLHFDRSIRRWTPQAKRDRQDVDAA